MTANRMRKKVIEFVSHADENVLEMVYKMLRIYEGDNEGGFMDATQKGEVENRTQLVKVVN